MVFLKRSATREASPEIAAYAASHPPAARRTRICSPSSTAPPAAASPHAGSRADAHHALPRGAPSAVATALDRSGSRGSLLILVYYQAEEAQVDHPDRAFRGPPRNTVSAPDTRGLPGMIGVCGPIERRRAQMAETVSTKEAASVQSVVSYQPPYIVPTRSVKTR